MLICKLGYSDFVSVVKQKINWKFKKAFCIYSSGGLSI